MKKQLLDFLIKENQRINDNYSLLKLSPADGSRIIDTVAGQFVQVEVPDSKATFLRRPISINYVDRADNTLWLLIRKAGLGTESLVSMREGRVLNIILPLGNGFSRPLKKDARILLAGGGVGVAPMYYLGTELRNDGHNVNFLLGARRDVDLLELDLFNQVGIVYCSTEDGSAGEKGLITHNTAADIYKQSVNNMFVRICKEGWLGKVLINGFILTESIRRTQRSSVKFWSARTQVTGTNCILKHTQ